MLSQQPQRNDALLERLERAKAKSKIKQSGWPDRHVVGRDGQPVPFHLAQQLTHDCMRRIVTLSSGTQVGKCGRFVVLLADGRRKFIRDVRLGDIVLSLGDDLKISNNIVTSSFCTGIQPTRKITTKTGRSIVVTSEHPLYSEDGWKAAGDFDIGDFIAVPRCYPELGTATYDKKVLR